MKAIFFDFDGTLTHKSPNIWKEIWFACGYEVGETSYYRQLFKDFLAEKITHQEWCDLCCNEYRKKNFNLTKLNSLADKIILIDGLEEALKTLKKQGYSIHILSGNILDVIVRVLGDNLKYFDSIHANDLVFDENGTISQIIGTKYDFIGKANFMKEYAKKNNIEMKDITFVGNGDNDEWAYLSGCKTICINPDNTDASNSTLWHTVREQVNDLTDILQDLYEDK